MEAIDVETQKKLPGIIFLRGGAVSILVVLSVNDYEEYLKTKIK